MFYQKTVNTRSITSMIAFLEGHSRYFATTKDEGEETSYAHCVKVPELNLTPSLEEKALQIVDQAAVSDLVMSHVEQFTDKHNGLFTIATHGAQGGYLVLHASHFEQAGYSYRCAHCNHICYRGEGDSESPCHKCGSDTGFKPGKKFSRPLKGLSVSSRGIDHRQDYNEYGEYALQEKVELVRSFDVTCDNIRNDFIRMLQRY